MSSEVCEPSLKVMYLPSTEIFTHFALYIANIGLLGRWLICSKICSKNDTSFLSKYYCFLGTEFWRYAEVLVGDLGT